MSRKIPRVEKACLKCGKVFLCMSSPIALKRKKFCSRPCNISYQHTIHGHCADWQQSPTHRTWSSMKQRCLNKNYGKYPVYGGVGITICARWLTFENFLDDMGERPVGTTIDRIDGTKGYFPGNCRWATPIEQQQHIRHNVFRTMDGRTQSLSAWARELKMDVMTLKYRIKRGWSDDQILNIKARYGNRVIKLSPSSLGP